MLMSTIRPDCTFCKLNQLNIKAYTMLMISNDRWRQKRNDQS